METLFLIKPLTGDIWYLEDSRKNLISRFKTKEDAEKFCKDNNYKLRIIK